MEIVKECEAKVGQDIWFPASNINFLCRQTDGRIVCEEMLPDYDIRTQLYQAIYEFHGKLFLVPWRARKILVYEIEKKEFHDLVNETLEGYQEKKCKYSVSVVWKNKLYLFCRVAPYIVEINLITEKMEVLSQLADGKILGTTEMHVNLWFSTSYVIWKSCVWLTLLTTPIVVRLSLEENTIQLYRLSIGCGCICKAEKDYFWLYSNRYHKVYKWSIEEGLVDEIGGIDLDGANYTVILEYETGILKCWNCKECIDIDVWSKKKIKQQKEELCPVFNCNECDAEAEYKYYEALKKQLIIENSCFFFKNPLSTYIQFIQKENRKDFIKEETIEAAEGQKYLFLDERRN